MSDLSPAELVALGGCVSDKSLREAKASLDENSTSSVDFTVRVRGAIQKGASTPDVTVEVDPTPNLCTFNSLCAALRLLGIGPVRLTKIVKELPAAETAQADDEFVAILEAEAQRRVLKLPRVNATVRGRAASVRVQASAERV